MSQYDFGTIDPFVVDGTTLAGMLNNWRDALYSLHRGSTRPDYAVPGMLWISDVGGPTNWVVNIYLGPSVGDRPVLQINTTTGAIAHVADQLTVALISAQAAANPAVVWNATGNAANQRLWRAIMLPSGVLQFQALDDKQAVLAGIDFNRDGTMRVVAPAAGDSSSLVPTTAWVKANASVGGVATPTYDATSAGLASGANFWAGGNTPMQITQGVQITSRAFTALDATHPIEVDANLWVQAPNSNAAHGVIALFIDGAANAVAQGMVTAATGSANTGRVYWQGVLPAGAHTFSLRLGSLSSSGIYTNMSDAGAAGGGAQRNTMTIREIGVGAVGPQGPPGPSGGPVTAQSFNTGAVALTDAGGWTGGQVLQITQGTEVFSRSFTAVDAGHPIEVDCGLTFGAGGVGVHGTFGLFIDGQVNAVAQQTCTVNTQWFLPSRLYWSGVLPAGPHTFSIRFRGGSGIYLLRNDGTVLSNNTYNYLKISEIGVGPIGPQGPPGVGNTVLQTVDGMSGAFASIAGGAIPWSQTTPVARTQGQQIYSANITPLSATSRLRIEALINYSSPTQDSYTLALFRDAGANAIAQALCAHPTAASAFQISMRAMIPSGSTAPTNFQLRMGGNGGGGFNINGVAGGTQAVGGGTMFSGMTITEVA